ncbi:DUF1345 domain-containing protein [Paraconexibacter antarcticus]|uniref:DUF1345 domain-containing protein n=1 Tax=Paraconexibacter antarcticus TaxID=2949664 RepID=A0ABY5E1H7_9ACTN|nr:DUF1345 domain-containing protein [Paraconexibacter antarcticus]UTI67064.1 DUF1345 domain-containing protein [Paraconexibacter antarcticus]
MLVGAGAGTAVGAGAAALGASRAFALMGWDAAALVFCVWTWWVVWPMGPAATANHSQRENPGRPTADLVLLGAAVASLIAVGEVLFGASHAPGSQRFLQAALAVGSIFVSWTLVHTVFTLKYARAYYAAPEGGIDFNESGSPQYSDFAYLSFTIGMTFQVSDTDLGDKEIRRIALRQAWVSYPLGAVIIAASINLISNLAK